MNHRVCFQNAENHWDNALPLGNGCFGAMLFYEDGRLCMPMNHYEVYYNIGSKVLPEEQMRACAPETPGAKQQRYREKMVSNKPKAGEPICKYNYDARKAFDPEPHGAAPFSGSYPATGEVAFSFAEQLRDAEHTLTLSVEDAAVTLELAAGEKTVSVRTVAAREDCILTRVTQSRCGLVPRLSIDLSPYRDLDAPQITWEQVDGSTFAYTVSRELGREKPFVFCGIVRLHGARGVLEASDFTADIRIVGDEPEFLVQTAVYTDWRYAAPLADGLAHLRRQTPEALYAAHRSYWAEFFARARVSLPDKFLEHVYYVNQYALDCCSGKDGVMKHHACGLNGLWDIRHPNLWGSMWYWDVNIQAAFAGVFTGNRLELAKVFSDGLLSYVELAERFARDVHNRPGVAMDYPYTVYHCIWPWCAQYLWQLYEYTLDEDYLRRDAYPLFLKLCRNAVAAFRWDAGAGCYSIEPDISPEQGPMTHDTTITVASVKYLLRFTLRAAEILGDTDPLLEDCRRLLAGLPAYALSGPGKYGIHLKDSAEAPDNLWIRHPSMLMPLFPTGEFDVSHTDGAMLQVLSNTVDFLEDNCEIGIFGGSWLAAAAARLGRGQTALRLLYERGIDHMLRSNGLTAEETERFINHCLLPRQPLYYPCMMEFTGEMLAAVNEMLLQSQNGLLRIFPAMPDGSREWERFLRNGWDIAEYIDRCVDYPAWRDVRFDGLLARGAFTVDAALEAGKLRFIRIHSQKGGTVRLTSPFLTPGTPVFRGDKMEEAQWDGGTVSFDTAAGETYLIAESARAYTAPSAAAPADSPLCRETYTKRTIFLGEDPDTACQKAMDGFLRDWYLGDARQSNHPLYKFDFGVDAGKTYTQTWTRQAYVNVARALPPIPFVFLGEGSLDFTVRRGYGFADAAGITAVDRGLPDRLRTDFVQGDREAEFLIEVPRGQYELLAVSGDAQEDSVTVLQTDCWRAGGETVKKGRYQCELIPVILKRDGRIRLKLSTVPGKKWKLNCLFLNAVKGY